MRRRFIFGYVVVALLLAMLAWQWFQIVGVLPSGASPSEMPSGSTVGPATLPGATSSAGSAKPLVAHHVQSTYEANSARTTSTGSADSSAQNKQRHNINPNAPALPPEHLAIEPIDHDHAMDLFADEIARQENGGGNDTMRKALKQFQRFAPSVNRADALRANMQAWAAQYTPSQREHFDIVTVECHSNICRILIAENGGAYHVVNGAYEPIAAPVFDIGRLLDSLSSQPWWSEMHIVPTDSEMRRNMQNGYTMYTIYVLLPADP